MALTYSGTMMDFSKTDPIIYRPVVPGESKLLRTERSDTKWLNGELIDNTVGCGKFEIHVLLVIY
jgi:hypothetical protein